MKKVFETEKWLGYDVSGRSAKKIYKAFNCEECFNDQSSAIFCFYKPTGSGILIEPTDVDDFVAYDGSGMDFGPQDFFSWLDRKFGKSASTELDEAFDII